MSTDNERLNELIPIYANNKLELDSYKKICDEENAAIKDLMLKCGKDTAESDGYVAKRTVKQTQKVDKEKMASVLKEAGYEHLITTRVVEEVNEDELEKAIYSGDVDKDTLTKLTMCKTVKEVVELRVTKIKNKKVGD